MAKPPPSRLSVSSLQDAPAPHAPQWRRWAVLAGVMVTVLLAMAWFDGGEEPLHPIAEAVSLPEPQQ